MRDMWVTAEKHANLLRIRESFESFTTGQRAAVKRQIGTLYIVDVYTEDGCDHGGGGCHCLCPAGDVHSARAVRRPCAMTFPDGGKDGARVAASDDGM